LTRAANEAEKGEMVLNFLNRRFGAQSRTLVKTMHDSSKSFFLSFPQPLNVFTKNFAATLHLRLYRICPINVDFHFVCTLRAVAVVSLFTLPLFKHSVKHLASFTPNSMIYGNLRVVNKTKEIAQNS